VDPNNLSELWQQILGSLELPSTRMLLSQQAQLVRLDAHRAVVQVAGNWMGMVQSRASLLEQAISRALGGSRQLVLENHSGALNPAPTPPATPPTRTPTPVAPSAQSVPIAAEPIAPAQMTEPAPVTAPPPITPPVIPAERSAHAVTKPSEPQLPGTRPMNSPMDDKVKRFAEFFNGQVLDVDLDT